MPVVTQDFLSPSAWLGARLAWSVVRSGERLSLARCSRGGLRERFCLPAVEWREGCAVRERFLKDRARGAILVAGLSPARVLLRPLESPLKQKAKAVQVWPSLLDTELPFPLERCQVAFLPTRALPSDDGHCTTGIAVREEDLEAELAALDLLGLRPDLMEPAVLHLLPPTPSATARLGLWRGDGEWFYALQEDGRLLASGRMERDAALVPSLTRLLRSHAARDHLLCQVEGDVDSEQLSSLHTVLDEQGTVEQMEAGLGFRLAETVFRSGPESAQLLDADRAGPRVQRRYASRRNQMALGLILSLLLTLGGMVAASSYLDRLRKQVKKRVVAVYQEVSDGGTAPLGQETLLAERYLADLRLAWEGNLPGDDPGVRRVIASLLGNLEEAGHRLLRLKVDADSFEIEFIPAGDGLRAPEVQGWKVEWVEREGSAQLRGRRVEA